MITLGKSVHGADVRLNSDEMMMLNNALNEVCNGVDISDEEFQTRLGWDRAQLRTLLDQIHSAIP